MTEKANTNLASTSSRLSIPPAMRYPAYRAYWLGTLASVSGFQILTFGQLWLIHELKESPLFLGYVGLANAIPAIALNLFGGAFADKLDKRRLIMVTQSVSAALIFILGTLTLLELVKVWHILSIALVAGAVNAFDQPARQALYPHLIARSAIMSAVALNSSIWQGTRVVAPAIAGLMITMAGTATAFYAASIGFLVMAIVIYFIRVPHIGKGGTGNPARDIQDGLRFIYKNSIFSFLIGMTFFNSFFGMAYIMLMPIFAVDILKVGADGQGVLLSAGGVGALLATIWLSSIGNSPRKGLMLIGGAIMFGLSVAIFGITSKFVGSYVLAAILMFLMGMFGSTYMISIMSSLQLMVPDNMRGRVMGFYGMTWSIMPLGGMQAGALANLIGAHFAIAIGGIAVAAFALGPAMFNSGVRNLGTILDHFDKTASSQDIPGSPAHR